MADGFGLRIGIEGEKEFKKALKEIDQSFKVLGSEMKLVDSQFEKNDKSIQALSARNTVLNKEIEAQKGKLDTLRSALDNAAESFGETDKRTQNWQIKLNEAQAELNKMEREVASNEKAISSMNDEVGDTKDEDKFKKSLADIDSQFKMLGSEMKLVDSQFDKNEKSVESLSARNSVLNKEIDTQKSKVETLRSALAHSAETYGENDQRTRDWQTQLNNAQAELNKMEREVTKNEQAIDEMGKETEDSTDSLDDLEAGLENAGKSAEKSGDKFDKLGSVLKGIGKAMAAAVAAVGAGIGVAAGKVNDCIDVYAGFEDSMLQVAATMGITSDEIANGSEDYEKLTNAAKEAGATTRYTASEAGEALNYLALAGYDADKAVETLPKVLDLAAAGGMDLATTSDLVTDAMSALGMETEELDTFVDQLAKTSQKSNTNVQQLGEGLLVCAGTASSTEQALTTTNTALGILADNGIKGAEGGTKLRNILLSLSTASGDAYAKLNELGVSVYDDTGNMRDLGDVMSDLNDSLGTLSQEDRTNAIRKIFNKTDIGAVNALLKGTSSSFATLSDSLEASSIDWEKYQDSAWYAANGVKDVSTDIAHSLNELGMSTEELQEHLQLEYGFDAEDALAAIESVKSSLETTAGDVTKISESLKQSSVDWGKYADSVWYANGNVEGLTEDVLYCTTKLGQSTDEVQNYLQQEYNLDADDALAVIESVNTSLEENGTRWKQLSGLIDDSTGAASEMAGTMEAGLAGTTRSFNSAMEGMQIEVGAIFADFKQTLMSDSIDIIRSFTKNLQAAGGDWGKIGEAIGQALGDIVNLINEYLPKVVEMGVQIIETLGSALLDNLDVLMETATSILMTLLNTVIAGLPGLVEAAAQIVVSLATGIADALPTLIPAIVQAVVTIVKTLVDNLPLILDAALQLITGLAEGLLAALPVLIEALPAIIQGLVDFMLGATPDIIQAGITLLSSLVTALPTIIDAIVSVLPQIITGLVKAIRNGIPDIIEAGVNLLTSLVQDLPSIITTVVMAIPEIVLCLIDALVECVPMIVDAGVQLLTSLVENLPEIISNLISVIPTIIASLVTALSEATPQIVEAGVQLLIALIQDLPTIIYAILGAIPQIISSIVSAITGSSPQVDKAGVTVFTALINNLTGIISTIVSAVPEIMSAVVEAFKRHLHEMVDIGKNIVKGLWDGIQTLKDWLWNRVSGWISDIWDGICDFFGIHSPSREMAWIGEMLVKGLSGSIDENGGEAVNAAQLMADNINDVFGNLADDMETALPTSFAFDVDTNSAVSAAKSMAEDMDGIFESLAADMSASLPTSFDISTNANIAGALSNNTPQSIAAAPLVSIQQMIVRSEDDIRKVSQNLYDLIQTGSRAQGRYSMA